MKKVWRSIVCVLMVALFMTGMSPVSLADQEVILSMGADLTVDQQSKVMELMGLDVVPTKTVFVTNEEERALLGEFVPKEQIGSRSLSCALVKLQDSDTGINVTTHNITWCTPAMYTSALATAGIVNAEVIIAAPTQVSGTAALAGIYKAYETAAGVTLSEAAKSVAGQELAITGQLNEFLGSDQATELIAQLKQEVIAQGLTTPEKIRPAIEQGAKELGITLNESQINMVSDLLLKIIELDLDPDQIAEQLRSISTTLENLQKAQESTQSFFSKVSDGFNAVVGWFKGLFGK